MLKEVVQWERLSTSMVAWMLRHRVDRGDLPTEGSEAIVSTILTQGSTGPGPLSLVRIIE